MSHKIVHGKHLLAALDEAGIITEIDRVYRVVIDIKATDVPRLYVHRYGDERLLQVMHTLDGAEIVREDRPDGGLEPIEVTHHGAARQHQ